MELRCYGEIYKVRLIRSTYDIYGNLAIMLESWDEEYKSWEPFGTLTVNICQLPDKNLAAIDVNNCPFAEDFIETYQLGKLTHSRLTSGFCIYPVYSMDLEKLDEFIKQGGNL